MKEFSKFLDARIKIILTSEKTENEWAKHFGVSRPSISNWKRRGFPVYDKMEEHKCYVRNHEEFEQYLCKQELSKLMHGAIIDFADKQEDLHEKIEKEKK